MAVVTRSLVLLLSAYFRQSKKVSVPSCAQAQGRNLPHNLSPYRQHTNSLTGDTLSEEIWATAAKT
jgi:hypothetical protein